MDLVTVSVDLDTSALQDKLDEIEGGLDEDRVGEIIREALSDAGLDDLSGTYVESDDLDGAIQSVLDNTDFESRISSLESLNTCGVDLNDLADIPQRVEALETDAGLGAEEVERIVRQAQQAITERVDDLQHAGGSYEARLKALEDKLDALSTESARGLTLLDLLTQAARLLGILH